MGSEFAAPEATGYTPDPSFMPDPGLSAQTPNDTLINRPILDRDIFNESANGAPQEDQRAANARGPYQADPARPIPPEQMPPQDRPIDNQAQH